jgi:hypothetical protein
VQNLRKFEFPRKLVATNRIVTVLIVSAVIVLVLASPFAVRWIATFQRSWVVLSNVGQTYGFAASLLSGLAFIAIGVSLFYQAHQTRIAQLQTTRTFQLELFKLAFDHPDLQSSWSRSVDLPYSEWRKTVYINLIFMYLRMSYVMREINDTELRRSMTNRFHTEPGRKYWKESRQGFEASLNDRRDRRFFEITEHEYQKAILSPPLEEPRKKGPQPISYEPLITFAAGSATMAIISMMFRRRQKR